MPRRKINLAEVRRKLDVIFRAVNVLNDDSGKPQGVWLSWKQWQSIKQLVNQLPVDYTERVETERGEKWSYTLTEDEIGLVALLSYYGENTSQPWNAPESNRLIGRVPESLSSVIKEHAAARRHGRTLDKFKNIKVFNDSDSGVSCCLPNGAEYVRLAKEGK